jgi:hypothetical protein
MKRRVFYVYFGYQKAYNAIEDSHEVISISVCYDLTDALTTAMAKLVYIEMKVVQVQQPTTNYVCEFIGAANAIETYRFRMKKASDSKDSVFIMDRSEEFTKAYDNMRNVRKPQLRAMTFEEKQGAGAMLNAIQRLLIDPDHCIETVRCLHIKTQFSRDIKKYIEKAMITEYFKILCSEDINKKLIKSGSH